MFVKFFDHILEVRMPLGSDPCRHWKYLPFSWTPRWGGTLWACWKKIETERIRYQEVVHLRAVANQSSKDIKAW